MPLGQRMLMAAAGRSEVVQLPTSFELISGGYLVETSGGLWLGRPQTLEVAGGWMLIYREATNHGGDTGAVFRIRFTDDEGETFTLSDTKLGGGAVTGFPIESQNAGGTLTDAILIRCPNDDILCLAHEENYSNGERYGTQQYRSSDEGETWSFDGAVMGNTVIAGGGQAVVVGSEIYVAVFVDPGADTTPPYKSAVYKSTNNGDDWAFVADITSTADDTNECSLVHLGGATFGSILRTEDTRTLKSISTDWCETWSAPVDIADDVNVLHRPMLWTFPDEPGRVYVTARDYVANNELAILRYSDDVLETWSDAFTPEEATAVDCGYTTFRKRSDGTYYYATYRGDNNAASLVQYFIEGVA